MPKKDHLEHARVTAICVNLALDSLEEDIRQELEIAAGSEVTEAMGRLLSKLKEQRQPMADFHPRGTC